MLPLALNGTPYKSVIVDFSDEGEAAEHLARWPIGRIPLLRDEARDVTLGETSIIIEYLDHHYPGLHRMIPAGFDAALEVRLWDRFFDLYVSTPMQKIVIDRIKPEGNKDAAGVTEARALLQTAYGMLDARMQTREWAAGGAFSLADCSAFPALFYAST
jgi:glutathione S-transferase